MQTRQSYTAIFLTIVISIGGNVKAQVSAEEILKLNQQIEAQNLEIQNLRNQLTSETSGLREKIDSYAPIAMVLFLFGGFCALWAQNTGRSPWVWFFTGLVFSVLAVIAVLIRNSEDNR